MADSFLSSAISAYKSAANMAGSAPVTEIQQQATPLGHPSFSEFLDGSTTQSINSLKGGETASLKGVMGKAELHDMVAAISNAELTLQTVVAVRDKVIGAYQDIMRMPI
jgi:flagellar hook-basal body complex protein FliE